MAERSRRSSGVLQQDLHQSVPFASLHAEAFLNLLRTSDQLQRKLRLALKPHGITDTQYNVLRILRGAGAHPLPCSEIGERLISQVPDITRLLDRLERIHLIRRARDRKDRRIVLSSILPSGLAKLKELDGVVERCVEKMLEHLTQQELFQMIALLESARHPELRKEKRGARTTSR
jgi:DNA-binding MarR family transcriptional regulator